MSLPSHVDRHPDSRSGHDLDAEFEVEVQADWASAWVVVRGNVDITSAALLDRAIEEALQSQPRKIHLMMSGVTSVDTPGASALAAAGERACAGGSRLVLHCRRSPARKAMVQEGLIPTWSTKMANLLRRGGRGEVTTVAVS